MNKKTIISLCIGTLILLICLSFTNIFIGRAISNEQIHESNGNTSNADNETIEASTKSKLKKDLDYLIAIKADNNLLLCNKKILLPKDYQAKDLVDSELPFLSYVQTRKLNKVTKSNAKDMFNAAKQDGINLLGASGYRSNAVQRNLFQSKVKAVGYENASKYSAPPGSSEHETGYALDIVSTSHQSLDTAFEQSDAFKWLNKNAHKFGFILRYPKGKENITSYNYEPWHYRYVGVEHATSIKENNLTLEEYLTEIDTKINFLSESLSED